MSIEKVWVIMENDFPEAVCASETLAEAYIEDRRRAEVAAQMPPGPHRRTHWRAYPFQVQQEERT